jgi:NADH:ubiquinone oxidoreductase subunit B-like Fe-S oxidoreductase
VVVAVGSCACTGNIFRDSYNIDPPIGRIIPVDAYIPGCPPKPEAMISAIVKLIAKLRGAK